MALLLDDLVPKLEAWLKAASSGQSLDEPLPGWTTAAWQKVRPVARLDMATLELERLLESRRLKERLSSHPFYAKAAAAEEGDAYWIRRTAATTPWGRGIHMVSERE